MPTLYIMIGPAGSGKTTFASQHFGPEKIVSTDTIRKMLFGDEADQRQGAEVFRCAYATIRRRLGWGLDVVFDATNTTDAARKEVLSRVKDIPCRKVAVYMNTPLEICKERNAGRERIVPEGVIEKQYNAMLKWSAEIPELFDTIVIVEGWNYVPWTPGSPWCFRKTAPYKCGCGWYGDEDDLDFDEYDRPAYCPACGHRVIEFTEPKED